MTQNNAVFPEEPASKGYRWHHKPAGGLVAEYKDTAAKTYGIDPTDKTKKADPAPQKPKAHGVWSAPKHAAPEHGKTQLAVKAAAPLHTAHAAAPKKQAAKKAAPKPHKPTAREEAAEEEKRHAKLSAEVWPKAAAEAKWHHQGAAAELAHIEKSVAGADPVAKVAKKGYQETAAEMETKHAREAEAAFPKRWFEAKKAQAKEPTKTEKMALEKRAQVVGASVWGKHTFRQMDLITKLAHDEHQVAVERKAASEAGEQELAHMNRINNEVFPASHKPLKTAKRAASKHHEHKNAMHGWVK